MVMLPPFEAMEAEEEMAPPAFKTIGRAPPLALMAALIARLRTALSVRVELVPSVLPRVFTMVRSPLPAAALAVLSVTPELALSEVWMVALLATAEFTVGVKALGLPPLKLPPMVAIVETPTSLAARRSETGRRNETKNATGRSRVFMARSAGEYRERHKDGIVRSRLAES